MSLADRLSVFQRAIMHPDRRLSGPLGLLLVIAIWTVARPYRGVRHDGILYTGQVVHYLWPDRLMHDLFFAYGSQDSFSIYSLLMAWPIKEFGVASASIAGLIFCQFLFLAAVWKLAGRIVRPLRWIAVLCVAVFPHTYASLNVFGFAENFLTARSLAEPLSLFALLAWSRHQRVLGGGLVLLAGAVHPLVTLPVMVVMWVMAIREDRRWAALALLAIPVIGLGLAGVAPFHDLFRRFDHDWWVQIGTSTKQVLMLRWEMQDWLSMTTDFLLLWAARRCGDQRLSSLVTAVLWASAGLLAVTLIGADLGRDVLITGLQLWRVLWLAHLLALMSLPLVALTFWRRGTPGRVVAVAAVAALLTVVTDLSQSWILVAWLAGAMRLQRDAAKVSPAIWRAAFLAGMFAVVGVTLISAVTTWRAIAGAADLVGVVMPVVGIFSLPALAILLAFALMIATARFPTWLAALAFALFGALGAAHWDQRSAYQRYVENSLYAAHPFDAFIPPQASVYWANGTLEDWVMLKRRQFFGPEQGAGAVFNSETAAEARRAHHAMMPLELQKELCQVIGGITGNYGDSGESCAPTAAILQEVCHAPEHPDFLVLNTNETPGFVATWNFTPLPPAQRKTFYLYDCNHV